jgi:hypothetical protein
LGLCTALVVGAERSPAYTIQGWDLDLSQRDFRVFNNFLDVEANDNQTPDPNFPGYQGAVMAIWKASVEWGCTLHGDGNGDPHQPGDLGSGGANFDVTFQGEASGVGGVNDNVHSALSGGGGGMIAFTEGGASGWRIRYYEAWTWEDGPGTTLSGGALDLQGVATRQYGFALGLAHSSVTGSTMATTGTSNVALRSIEADDSAGIQAIYGVCTPAKPVVTGVVVMPSAVQLLGQNFDVTGNEVWFTPQGSGGDGTPVKVLGVPSNGTSITVPIPAAAGSGDVLVRIGLAGGAGLSTPWPLDLGTPCADPLSYCTSSPNSVGPGALIENTGSTSISAANLVLVATGCPPNKPGLFFYGSEQVDLPFGEGRRCVGGALFRLPVVSTGPAGTASHALDYDAHPVALGPGQLVPGGRWNFQFWYRDPAGGAAGFNASDGLSTRFCP